MNDAFVIYHDFFNLTNFLLFLLFIILIKIKVFIWYNYLKVWIIINGTQMVWIIINEIQMFKKKKIKFYFP